MYSTCLLIATDMKENIASGRRNEFSLLCGVNNVQWGTDNNPSPVS